MRTVALLAALALVVTGCASGGERAQGQPSASAAPTASSAVVAASPSATLAPTDSAAPAVSYVRADLAAGAREGVVSETPGVSLATSGLATGTYHDAFGSGAIAFESGRWTSPWTQTPFAFDGLIASWTATTPASTWIALEAQARGSGRETKWYVLGIWASGDGDIHRTTQRSQGDADGTVSFDTFARAKAAPALDGYRLRITLHRRAGSAATPVLGAASAMVSKDSRYAIPSPWSGTAVDLAVPTYSQETHTGHYPEYDNGGEAWCSPTSTAMLLRFWGTGPSAAELAAFPGSAHVDGQVDHAARFTYDWSYKGAGNWPFNTAHVATYGLDGFVTRLRSLVEAQRFIQSGIPLVASINGKLPGFLLGETNGHLLVVRGFTASGDVVVNDPAVLANAQARKVYARADFERVWLEGSGGVVYVIRPNATPLPANVPGLPANW